jgi:hypothetical protein
MHEQRRYGEIPIQVNLEVAHGDSPVWLFGPIEYEEMLLSSALEQEMREWEADFYEFWRAASPETMTVTPAWRESAQMIARLLADELGEDFVVICQDRHTRSEHPATNSAASAAIRARATGLDSIMDNIRDRQAKNPGSSFKWTAMRPSDQRS